jgi:hypothetical protein
MIGRCAVADVGGGVGGRGPGALLLLRPCAFGVARLPGLQGQPLRLLCENARRLRTPTENKPVTDDTTRTRTHMHTHDTTRHDTTRHDTTRHDTRMGGTSRKKVWRRRLASVENATPFGPCNSSPSCHQKAVRHTQRTAHSIRHDTARHTTLHTTRHDTHVRTSSVMWRRRAFRRWRRSRSPSPASSGSAP